MKNTIWLDVDGVLLDYTRAFLEFTGLGKKGVTYDNLFDYDLTKLFPSADACYAAMLEFTKSERFMYLQAIAKRRDVEMLKNIGFTLKVITQLPTDSPFKVNRVRNLTTFFGPVFDEVIFTDRGQSKLDYIIERPEYRQGLNWLIEDNPILLVEVDAFIGQQIKIHGGKTNLMAIAVEHPYNTASLATLEHLVVVPNFEVAADIIANGVYNG